MAKNRIQYKIVSCTATLARTLFRVAVNEERRAPLVSPLAHQAGAPQKKTDARDKDDMFHDYTKQVAAHIRWSGRFLPRHL